MFRTNFKELKAKRCELDLTENSLKAFADFVYCFKLDSPSENFGIALELLKLSHEIEAPALEQALKELIIQKPVEWFSIDGALQLFLLTKSLQDCDALKEKAIGIMKM